MVLHTYLLCLVVAGSIHFHSHLKDMRDFSLFINKPTDSDAAASSVGGSGIFFVHLPPWSVHCYWLSSQFKLIEARKQNSLVSQMKKHQRVFNWD